MTLVEDEVHDRENGAKAVRQLVVLWDAIWDVGGANLVLGANEALRHGRLRHQQGAGDLRRLQPCDQSKCQRHLRLGAECRMAAREDQSKPVIVHGTDLRLFVGRVHEHRLVVTIVARRLAT